MYNNCISSRIQSIAYFYSLTDYYRLSVTDAGDGRETSVGALCPNLPRNDLTRQYIDGVGDIGPRVFFSSLEEDLVNFNRPFCLAFTMLTTNSSNSAPLMSIVSASSAEPVFSLVIDSAGVTLTLGTSSVTFPAPQFADGNSQQLQICTNGADATLYSNCGSLGSLPFSGSSAADFNNAILFVLRSVTTKDIFQVSVSYLALYIKNHARYKEELSQL